MISDIMTFDELEKLKESYAKTIVEFDQAKDCDFSKEKTEEYLKNAEKELNKEFNKILQEKGFVTTLEMAKLVDRIVLGLSEDDIRLKYAYFDHFGIE